MSTENPFGFSKEELEQKEVSSRYGEHLAAASYYAREATNQLESDQGYDRDLVTGLATLSQAHSSVAIAIMSQYRG